MNADAFVALRPVEVVVTLGGWEYTIEPLPAADWISAVLAPGGGSIVPGLLGPEDRREAWGDFGVGEYDEEELAAVERDALRVAAGRPWWEADRLIRSLVLPENWGTLHGELMLRGIDLERISLAAALNAVYALVRRLLSHDEAALARFDAGLKAIPPGVKAEDLEEELTDAQEFAAMMAEQQQMFGGGG